MKGQAAACPFDKKEGVPMAEEKKICPFCGGAMALHYTGWMILKEKQYLPVEYLEAQLYLCPQCRFMAWFKPLTAVEEFEKEQQALDEIKDPVKKFEILFRDYSEKKLQKVIDGRDYLPEAKKAAQNLLRRKGE